MSLSNDEMTINELKLRLKDMMEQNIQLSEKVESFRRRVDIVFDELENREYGSFMSVCDAKKMILGALK